MLYLFYGFSMIVLSLLATEVGRELKLVPAKKNGIRRSPSL